MKRFILILSLFFAAFSCAMQDGPPSPYRRLSSVVHGGKWDKAITNAILTGINALQSGKIYIDAFVFTDSEIANALVAAKKRGVTVSVNLAGHRPENRSMAEVLKKGGIDSTLVTRYVLHLKRFILNGVAANGKTIREVIEGSYNPTNLAKGHDEIVAITRGNEEGFFKDHVRNHKQNRDVGERTDSPLRGQRAPLLTTPTRPTTKSSLDIDHIETLIGRVNNLTRGGRIDVNTMNLTEPKFIRALCSAAQRAQLIRVFVNRNSRNLVNLACLIGHPNVEVYEHEPGKGPGAHVTIAHQKSFVRADRNPLAVIKSSNETAVRRQLDTMSLFPRDNSMIEAIMQANDAKAQEYKRLTRDMIDEDNLPETPRPSKRKRAMPNFSKEDSENL